MNAEMALSSYLMYRIQSKFSCIYGTTPFFFQHTSLCVCIIMHVSMYIVHLLSPHGQVSLHFPQATPY